MKKEIHLKGRWDLLKYTLQIGITLVIGTTLVVFSRLNITTAFTLENLENFPIAQLPTFLLFETIFVISFWIQAALGEFQIFRDYFEEYAPPLPRSSFTITVGIAILLGLLGYFSYKIISYSSIFVCLKLFEIWGLWLRQAVPQTNYRILLYIKAVTVNQQKSKVHDTPRGNMNKNLNT